METTKLYFISHGYLENDAALNVLMYTQATIDEPNKPAIWHRVPSIIVLISHPKLGWILVDTGSHPEAMNGRWPEAARKNAPLIRTAEDMLDARLAELRLTPADIDYVIASHLHIDHAGGLCLFQNTKAGKRVIVHEQELKQSLFDLFVHNQENVGAYLRSDFVGLDGIEFDPVAGDTELADDIQLLWLPGHTAGQLGVMVHLKNAGTFIFISDAAYNAINYGPPIRLPGILHDSTALVRSLERVRWLERRYDAKVIFGHDLAQFETLKKSPDYYD